jgi:rubrerythrin
VAIWFRTTLRTSHQPINTPSTHQGQYQRFYHTLGVSSAMDPLSGVKVPNDMWVCSSCSSPNLFGLHPTSCMNCSASKSDTTDDQRVTHFQGETRPSSGTEKLPTSDVWICNECGAGNVDWSDNCPVCGQPSAKLRKTGILSFRGDVQAVDEDSLSGGWLCAPCGAANSLLTSDFCPLCGTSR